MTACEGWVFLLQLNKTSSIATRTKFGIALNIFIFLASPSTILPKNVKIPRSVNCVNFYELL
jgi:hypothetical protein